MEVDADVLATHHREWERAALNKYAFNAGQELEGAETFTFDMSIVSASGIRIPAVAAEAVKRGGGIEHCLRVSFWHAAAKKFVGFTKETDYVVDPRATPNITTMVTIPHNALFMFVSNIADNVHAVVELVVVVRDKGFVRGEYGVGWAMLPITRDQAKKEVKIQANAGSPRSLLYADDAAKKGVKLRDTYVTYVVDVMDPPAPPLRLFEPFYGDNDVPAMDAVETSLRMGQIVVTPAAVFLEELVKEVGLNAIRELGAEHGNPPELSRLLLRISTHTTHVTQGAPIELPLVAIEGGKTYAFDGHSVLRKVPVHEMVTLVLELVAEVAITVPSKIPSLQDVRSVRQIVAGWHAMRPFCFTRPAAVNLYFIPGPARTHQYNLVFSGIGEAHKRGVCNLSLLLEDDTPNLNSLTLSRALLSSTTSHPLNSLSRAISPPESYRGPLTPHLMSNTGGTMQMGSPMTPRGDATPAMPSTSTPPYKSLATMRPPEPVVQAPVVQQQPPEEELNEALNTTPPILTPRAILHADPLPVTDVLQLPRSAQALIVDSGAMTVTDSSGQLLPLLTTAPAATPDETQEADGMQCDLVIQLLGLRIVTTPEMILSNAPTTVLPATVACSMQVFNNTPYTSLPLQVTHAGSDAYLFKPVLPKDATITDPSIGHVIRFTVESHRSLEFARYLSRRALTIDITDTDALLPVGSIRVPLKTLMRQRRSVAQIAGEFDVMDPAHNSPVRMRLLLRIANIAQSGPIPEKDRKKTGHWVRPIGDQRHRQHDGDPRHSRVNTLKKMGIFTDHPQSQPQTLPHGDEETVEHVRGVRRPHTLAHTVHTKSVTEIALAAYPGCAVLVEHPLWNTLPHDATFTPIVDDPLRELSVVTDTQEWRALRGANGRDPIRAELDMFAPGGKVLIHSGERVLIPLKFLSFSAQQGIKERKINVTFLAESNEMAVLVITICNRPIPVDRTIRCDAKEGEILRRRLIVPDDMPAPARVWSTVQDVFVQPATLPRGGGAIDLKCRIGRAPESLEFLLVLSDDLYMARVREVWRVICQPLQWLDVTALVGQGAISRVVVRGGDVPRLVRAYSSVPELLKIDPAHNFSLPANGLFPVTLSYRPLTAGSCDVRVNVVDVEQNCLVDAWLVALNSTTPAPSRTYDVSIQRDRGVTKRIALANPYQHSVAFKLTTDRPGLLTFKSDLLSIGVGETGFMGLKFLPSDLARLQEEILVFVTDSEDKIDECVRIRAHYL